MDKKKKNPKSAPEFNNSKPEKAKKKRKPLTPSQKKTILITVISVLLLAAICVSCVFLVIIPMREKDKNFDYLKSDLTKYLNLPAEKYKNYSMSLNIAKPREIDVDIALLSMLAADRDEKPQYEGAAQRDVEITAGDTVNIYYRGYIEIDGIQKTVVSNLSADTYSSFVIGGCTFPSESYPARGVEVNLLGKLPCEYEKFTKIKKGEVKDGQVIYLTFERLVDGEDESKTESGTSERIDLTSDKLDEAYGVGFKEKVIGLAIGAGYTHSFKTELDGKSCTYSNVKVEFVTECERNPLTVMGYYPYSTGSTVLNNKEVTFEIYVQSVQVYDTPELNDEYIEKKVMEVNSGLRMDELLEYEGDNLVEKYRAYAWEYLMEQYEETLRSQIAQKMWNYYIQTAEVKRVPGIKVDEIYLEYYSEVKNSFETNNGVIYNEMTEETETYEDLSGYAKIYLGLYYSEEDFTVTIEALAEDLVIERMIMYYIMKNEGIEPTEDELAAKIAEVKQDYMDEYVYQYLADFESQREEFESSTAQKDKDYAAKMDRIILAWKSNNLTDAEYAEFYAAREKEMFDYYDEEHFVETAYYEWVTDYVVTWADYSTLDDPATE
ncbi:MAG: hypothetical protein IJW03_04040 [Clostridia bacterium]|nr:hypothetical protein [Clostridia bacterium]